MFGFMRYKNSLRLVEMQGIRQAIGKVGNKVIPSRRAAVQRNAAAAAAQAERNAVQRNAAAAAAQAERNAQAQRNAAAAAAQAQVRTALTKLKSNEEATNCIYEHFKPFVMATDAKASFAGLRAAIPIPAADPAVDPAAAPVDPILNINDLNNQLIAAEGRMNDTATAAAVANANPRATPDERAAASQAATAARTEVNRLATELNGLINGQWGGIPAGDDRNGKIANAKTAAETSLRASFGIEVDNKFPVFYYLNVLKTIFVDVVGIDDKKAYIRGIINEGRVSANSDAGLNILDVINGQLNHQNDYFGIILDDVNDEIKNQVKKTFVLWILQALFSPLNNATLNAKLAIETVRNGIPALQTQARNIEMTIQGPAVVAPPVVGQGNNAAARQANVARNAAARAEARARAEEAVAAAVQRAEAAAVAAAALEPADQDAIDAAEAARQAAAVRGDFDALEEDAEIGLIHALRDRANQVLPVAQAPQQGGSRKYGKRTTRKHRSHRKASRKANKSRKTRKNRKANRKTRKY
jgi:hypothetical protein